MVWIGENISWLLGLFLALSMPLAFVFGWSVEKPSVEERISGKRKTKRYLTLKEYAEKKLPLIIMAMVLAFAFGKCTGGLFETPSKSEFHEFTGKPTNDKPFGY